MGSAAVDPGEVTRQLVLECGRMARDQNWPPGALGGPNASLHHRQTPIFSQSPESMINPVVTRPPRRSGMTPVLLPQHIGRKEGRR